MRSKSNFKTDLKKGNSVQTDENSLDRLYVVRPLRYTVHRYHYFDHVN